MTQKQIMSKHQRMSLRPVLAAARRFSAVRATAPMMHFRRTAHLTRSLATLCSQAVEQEIASQPIVVFTKSYCPFCRDLVERFVDAEVPAHVIQLDKFENGNDIKAALQARTGQQYVPYVFVKGQHHDSESMTDALKGERSSAPAVAILAKAGITAPGEAGYFRP